MAEAVAAARIAAALVVLCIVAAACSSSGTFEATTPTPTSGPATSPTSAPTPTASPTAAAEPEAATSAPAPTATPFPEFPVGALSWEPCGGSFECAELTVPIDHGDPTGETMELAVIRVPAAEPDLRIGSVLFNPGGPGAPGTGFLRNFLGALPGVERRFDIVSWDPRGVGDSAGLRCVDDVAAGINEIETPHDGFADDLAGYVADNVEIGGACLAAAGELLDNVGTVATARDLDLLRRALGDEQLTYLGYSYGTRIGAVYAALFPGRIRALVLDGAFPPGLGSEALAGNVIDLETTLGRIDRTCALEPTCAVRSQGVVSTVDRLLDELDAETPGDPLGLTERSALIGATLLAIYVPTAWQTYTEALGDALAGNLERIEQLADFWYDDGGDFSDIYRGSNLAIMCADRAYPATRDEALADLLGPLDDAPTLGPMFLGATCEGWPVDGDALPLVSATAVVPALVIGNTQDPATPLRWARQLADDLPGSSLVTFVGDGHTIAGRGNGCVDSLVERFLVDLVTPPPDTVCRAPTGILGVTIDDAADGVAVTGVTPGGPADRAGIAVGDVIVALDGRPVDDAAAVVSTAGQQLDVTILRDGTRLSVTLAADRRPWTLGD